MDIKIIFVASMHKTLLIIAGLLLFKPISGQNGLSLSEEQTATGEALSFISLKKTSDNIILDGILEENAWSHGIPAKEFWQYFPNDSAKAVAHTEIYMTFDEQNLYVGIKCFSDAQNYIVSSLKRDYRAGGSDNISLMFDTFNDKTNAFLFGINPYGVRREALISNGGLEIEDFVDSWDNKWFGEAKIHDGYWAAELAIPFKTLRFNEGSKKWRFNCYRFDTQNDERTNWIRIPRNQWVFNLAYMGDMHWEEAPKKPKTNISFIPFATANYAQDFEGNTDPKYNVDGGFDAKVAITSGMNLDVTFNPDFSQVEVDRQVTDLQRFEIFFPERRQFFLENADLFGRFGQSRINPFFSRRIGVSRDTSTDTNIQNRIWYGARLNGKIGENWRLGLLNMQTAKDDENGMPAFNYTVAALQKKVFSRSNIGVILVNKEALTNEKSENFTPYNRVLGVDYNIANEDNTWTGKIYYQQAITTSDLDNKRAHGFELTYTKRHYSLEWLHQYVGEGFDAEVGFVPRKNFWRINPQIRTFFYPKSNIFNQHGPGAEISLFYKPNSDLGVTDHQLDLFWDFNFRNSSRGRVTLRNEYIYLFDDFEPTRVQPDSTTFLPAESDYNFTYLDITYNSDRRKIISYRLNPIIGQFYNGTRIGINSNWTARFQPYVSVGLQVSYNYLKLDNPFEPVSLFLIGPRFDITFSKNIFLTTFFQYNSQIDNLNINARLQWRFAPVSDMFLVYTDNYGTNPFGKKNRALVFKLTYWLNL